MDDLAQTPLYDMHIRAGAKMVPFAGWSMPVQFEAGVMKEHLHCRAKAGLFDVSHMGQVLIEGPSWDAVANGFETLVPQDVLGLEDGRQRYGFFTNDTGGIRDDLMFARRGKALFVVVNAACKEVDLAHMHERLGPLGLSVTEMSDRALIAVQGPAAAQALSGFAADFDKMRFMDICPVDIMGAEAWVSRSGYTGEDGFEISVPADLAEPFCTALLEAEAVAPVGLGARDSLRLEAGLCLYGHDMDTSTTPVEAGLVWSIQKIRRTGGARAGGFPGADVVLSQISNGAERRRVGLRPEGRAPMREGVQLFADAEADKAVGRVTSGGFGPTVQGPVAMGYVPSDLAAPGQELWGEVRGKRLPLTVVRLPFVPANFKR